MSNTTRRDFLIRFAPLLAAPFIIPALVNDVFADNANFQSEWRYCNKCGSLFFNGFPSKGTCPAGAAHNAQGINFTLSHGNQLTETEKAQANWRYCGKCFSMFYDGFADKGKCAGGGGHSATGFKFRLAHDIAGDGRNQSNWRYCQKCHVMFYDGFPGKGRCAGGGAHSAYGYTFVLPHDTPPDLSIRSNVTTDGWAPIGGWMQFDAHSDGSWGFSGHIHNSGAVDIRYTLAGALVTPSGQSFGFARNNHRVDGTQTVFGRDRDDDWNAPGNDIEIARNWDQVSRGALSFRLVAAANIVGNIENFLNDLAKNELKRLRQSFNVSGPGQLAGFYMKLLTSM